MTRSGVEHKLVESIYNVTVDYGSYYITFYFSTDALKNKFMNDLKLNRLQIKQSLENRFKFKFFLADDFCDVVLYRRTETRGFCIKKKGVVYEWPMLIEYNGQEIVGQEYDGLKSND